MATKNEPTTVSEKKPRRSISKQKLYRETVKMMQELGMGQDTQLEDYLASIKNSMMDDLIGDLDG